MPHKLAKVYVRLNEVIFLPNHFTKLTFKRKWPSANAMWLFPVPFKKQSPEHIWRALREFERMMHEYACWKALWRRDLVLVPISSVWLGILGFVHTALKSDGIFQNLICLLRRCDQYPVCLASTLDFLIEQLRKLEIWTLSWHLTMMLKSPGMWENISERLLKHWGICRTRWLTHSSLY